MALIGKVVRKEIDGVGFCSGTVQSYDPSGYYKIVYDNGVTETSKLAEFAALVAGEGKSDETPVQVNPLKRRTKRPREEIKRYGEKLQDEVNVTRSVDLNDPVPEDAEGLRGNVDLNRGDVETLAFDLNMAVPEPDEGYEENSSNKRRRLIDLNLDASFDLDDAEVVVDKREGWFDLNVAADVEDDVLVEVNGDDEVQESNLQGEIGVKDNLETGGCKEVHVAEVSIGQNSVSLQDLNAPDSNGTERDHDRPEHVDKSLSDREIPDEEDTSGRRSARRVLAGTPVSSSTVTACLADEVSPSPSVNTLTAEKNGIFDGEGENISVPLPKPELPPSSPVLNLDGLPILYVFATYSFLRSFSTVLFLSPFELKDFVEALRCPSPSLLFASIHVSVLQILRKSLEKLADEDDQSATRCLRSLDWDMLDVVNYPLYVVEYLLFSGCKDRHGVVLTRSNFFRNEYFRLPMNLKVEILTCLCAGMIDAEVVRSELNKRSVAVEPEMGTNRKTNTEVRGREGTMVEPANDFSSNIVVVDGSVDGNGYDCFICKMDGKLLCCDGCPAAYHSKCVGVACDLLPEGVWYCPECSFDRREPGWKPGKQVRGSKFLEIDTHGRKYYSSCGYLLVIDTGSVNYYHVNDVILVLEQLNSCGSLYNGVTSAIRKHWNIPVKAPISAPEKHATSGVKEGLEETSSNGGSYLRCHSTLRKISGSAIGPEILNMSSENSAETAHNDLDVQSHHEPESSSNLDVMKEPKMMNTRKEVRPNAQSESGYRNQYIFAQMATLISEEMARNSPDPTNDMRFDEEIASTQMKTILMKTTKFQWPNIQDLYLDAWKEKCGWCHFCKSQNAGSETNCLFNMSLGALRGPSESEIANSQPIDNRSHLMAIIWQMLSMESRLQGLLVGPWLNPQHSRIWREHILNASSISSLRHLLVEFEANLHHLVLSSQWLNYVDSAVEMGSSRHVLIASTRSSSKTTIGERRGTMLESGVNPTAKKNGGLNICWWRGGQLSRQLFNWKVLPRSLVSKAARQGGSVNIPEITYPENSEPAKRSRRVAWKAAVESSTTSEQLGLQVRTLYSYIKWDDFENSHLSPASDKESKKSFWLFKKAVVREKCIEGETVKYLLDFGKRKGRIIPKVVLKYGRMIEESSSESRTYWLNESYMPLHLLKEYEERNALRKNSKPGGSFKRPEIDKVRKRSSEGKGLSYLFGRAERSESALSEQCKKHEKVVANKPLRRSDREPKQVIRLRDESQVPRGSKKRKLETEKGKRRQRCSSYWLNGLRLSRKPDEERVDKFWKDGCSKVLKNSDSVQVRRKCRLCGSMDSESQSILIACEICEEWYHGDACGINDKNASNVIGFQCHLCRELPPPSCPHE